MIFENARAAEFSKQFHIKKNLLTNASNSTVYNTLTGILIIMTNYFY